MIYGVIEDNQSSQKKSFFVEKIKVLIATVNEISQLHKLSPPDAGADWITMAKQLGIIQSETEVKLLQTIVKKYLFQELIKCLQIVQANYDLIAPYIINLNDSERNKRCNKPNSTSMTLVDLFCGAGGLSLGFIQCGYRVIFANDFDPLCIETYRLNHPDVPDSCIQCGDIKQKIEDIRTTVTENVDVVIGGPPCQGFSTVNKHHRVIDDPRNELYKYFIKAVSKLSPKIVVMENVKGMLKIADQVVEDYSLIECKVDGKTHSYKATYHVINSADYGVAQNRERLIYIAVRTDLIKKYKITPDSIFDSLEHLKTEKINLSTALEGMRKVLPPHTMGVGEIDSVENGKKIDINPYPKGINSYIKNINCNRVIPLIYNHKARYCSLLNQEIYSRMKPGDDATAPQIADIMPYPHRNDKFVDKYYRLYPDRPCRTITAHMRSDCHSHIHPTEDRTLTPREAARVQSFPDDYLFLGPYLKTYIQIGNAVPVIMARAIAKAIEEPLKRIKDEDQSL